MYWLAPLWTTQPALSGYDRAIYVANAGSDVTGSGRIGNPFATIDYAVQFMRNGYGDRLYLHAGDTFSGNFENWNRGGFSPSRPMIISRYGAGARPLVNTGTNSAMSTPNANFSDLWVMGIEFYGSGHNGTVDIRGITIYDQVSRFLLEDCYVHNYSYCVIFQGDRVQGSTNIQQDMRMRACVIADAWMANATQPNCQGIYASQVNGLLVEWTTFDQCGWATPLNAASHDTGLRRGIYFAGDNTSRTWNTVVRHNACMRTDGFQIRSGGEIRNNLFSRTKSGCGVGNPSNSTEVIVAGVQCSMDYNTVVEMRRDTFNEPCNGIYWTNLTSSSSVNYNLVANSINPQAESRALWARSLKSGSPVHYWPIVNTAFETIGNVVYNSGVIEADEEDPSQYSGSWVLRNNGLTVGNIVLAFTYPFTFLGSSSLGILNGHVRDNSWYSPTVTDQFYLDYSHGTFADFETIVNATGDSAAAPGYPDPTRTLARYRREVLGVPTLGSDDLDHDALCVDMRNQDMTTWKPYYSANAIASWIRAGCNMDLT